MNELNEVIKKISELDNVLITCHKGADPDAFASCMAMDYILEKLGKKKAIFIETGKPKNFDFINHYIYDNLESLPFNPQLIIFLDCGDLKRSGDIMVKYFENNKKTFSINLDHHIDNKKFAKLNWIEATYAATSQLIYYIAKELKIDLSPPLSEYIYFALNGDTGSFSFSNTNSEIFRIMADLCDSGLNIEKNKNLIEKQNSLGRLKLWALGLNRAQTFDNDKIIYTYITRDEINQYNCSDEDLEGLVEFVRHVKNTIISVFIREENKTQCKISLRSEGDVDVRKIAAIFNGGGHKNAAGATIFAGYQSTIQQILQAAKNSLE